MYDGNGDVLPVAEYIPGLSEVDIAANPDSIYYVHMDHLGSTWFKTPGTTGMMTSRKSRAIRSAFGELVKLKSGPVTRYGYAGAWGYQEHDMDTNGEPDNVLNAGAAENFPYLHVGYRYYDPATGRFLQRDPIGLNGGLNVYAYVKSSPLRTIDPSGLMGRTFIGDPMPGQNFPRPPSERTRIPYGGKAPTPKVPWWKPSFRFTPLVCAKIAGAAAAGYVAGTLINHSPRVVGGKKISDYIGDWAAKTCTRCFLW